MGLCPFFGGLFSGCSGSTVGSVTTGTVFITGLISGTTQTVAVTDDIMTKLIDTVLQFSTGIGFVTFSHHAVSTMAGEDSGKVTFEMEKISTSTLTKEQQAAVGDRPVYRFSVTVGGTSVSEFASAVTISVPYTLQEGEDPNAIVVYYVDASGNLQPMIGAYDRVTGTVTFETTHFSDYVIGYNKVSFSDVTESDWYADAVTFIAARGITGGTADRTFSPNATLTRGQFIVMLMRAYGISPLPDATDNFADAGDMYYGGYLAAAKQLGITNGVGDNMFKPEQAITRQEMFTLLYNALTVMDKLPMGESGQTLLDFSDASNVASWAQGAML